MEMRGERFCGLMITRGFKGRERGGEGDRG